MPRAKAKVQPEGDFIPVEYWRWRYASKKDGEWFYGPKPPVAAVYMVEKLYVKIPTKGVTNAKDTQAD